MPIFFGVEDWILLGVELLSIAQFHPIPLYDMAVDCFLGPTRYSDTPISSQQWEQTSRCSWHADGWRPIPGWCYQGSASWGTACCFWFPRLGWWESFEKSGSRSWGWKTKTMGNPLENHWKMGKIWAKYLWILWFLDVSGRCSTKKNPKTDGFLQRRTSIHPWPGSFGSDEAPIYSNP